MCTDASLPRSPRQRSGLAGDFVVNDVIHADVCAFCGQSHGDAAPDALAGPRNQRFLSVQQSHVQPLRSIACVIRPQRRILSGSSPATAEVEISVNGELFPRRPQRLGLGGGDVGQSEFAWFA